MNLYHYLPTGQLREFDDAHMAALKQSGNPKADGWAVAPDKPTHDAATQHAPEWQNGQWVVRDKSAEELAAEQAAKDDTAERQTIKTFIVALKAGTGTSEQRMKRVERVCAYLLNQL